MHHGDVGIGYEPGRNCGCIVAMLVIAPFAWIWVIGSALGGFGCEGAEPPCTPHYGRFWLGIAVLIGATLALAWLINASIRWIRNKRG